MIVTQDQIDTYAREGATHIPGAFGPEWVAKLTAAFDRIAPNIDAPDFQRTMPGNKTLLPTSWDRGEGALLLRNIFHHAPEFRDWLAHSPAAEIVGRVTGADHVAFWSDASFSKEGADDDTATPWHNDGSTYPFWGEHAPSLWIALTDTGMDNAPLQTLTGSHRTPWRYRSPMSGDGAPTPDGYRPWDELLARATAPDAPIRVWPAKAGDAIVIHPQTIHASLRRTAADGGRRLAFTTRWVGSDIVWRPDAMAVRLTHLLDDPRMVVGEPPSQEIFEIAWRR